MAKPNEVVVSIDGSPLLNESSNTFTLPVDNSQVCITVSLAYREIDCKCPVCCRNCLSLYNVLCFVHVCSIVGRWLGGHLSLLWRCWFGHKACKILFPKWPIGRVFLIVTVQFYPGKCWNRTTQTSFIVNMACDWLSQGGPPPFHTSRSTVFYQLEIRLTQSKPSA